MTGRPPVVTDFDLQEMVTASDSHITPASADPATVTDFMAELHAELDVHLLIDIFSAEVRRSLPCDGIEYRHDGIKLYHTDGSPGQHSCKYQLRHAGELLGEVSFTREQAFYEHELATIEIMVGGLILPLRNALKFMHAVYYAHRDELTGLRNSSYYHDHVETEIRRSQRYKIPFSLLLIDLDDFRQINESCGREAGDTVLVEMARRLVRTARSSDIVFRNSGDRFLVFLPNTGSDEASVVAERIKRSVLTETFIYANTDIRLTLSIGVATVSPQDTRYRLTDRADSALSHAKLLGKDRIHVQASPETIHEGLI